MQSIFGKFRKIRENVEKTGEFLWNMIRNSALSEKTGIER